MVSDREICQKFLELLHYHSTKDGGEVQLKYSTEYRLDLNHENSRDKISLAFQKLNAYEFVDERTKFVGIDINDEEKSSDGQQEPDITLNFKSLKPLFKLNLSLIIRNKNITIYQIKNLILEEVEQKKLNENIKSIGQLKILLKSKMLNNSEFLNEIISRNSKLVKDNKLSFVLFVSPFKPLANADGRADVGVSSVTATPAKKLDTVSATVSSGTAGAPAQLDKETWLALTAVLVERYGEDAGVQAAHRLKQGWSK